MTKTDLTFIVVVVLLAVGFVLDVGLISVLRDMLNRKD